MILNHWFVWYILIDDFEWFPCYWDESDHFEYIWNKLKEYSFDNSEENETHIWIQIGLKLLLIIQQYVLKW